MCPLSSVKLVEAGKGTADDGIKTEVKLTT